MDNRKVIVTAKRLRSIYLYDTEEKSYAGSTLATCPGGPNNGVHLRARARLTTPQKFLNNSDHLQSACK
jgi:hypothetical protein